MKIEPRRIIREKIFEGLTSAVVHGFLFSITVAIGLSPVALVLGIAWLLWSSLP